MKERSPLDILNVSLEGISAALAIANKATLSIGLADALKAAAVRCEEAQQALLTIQFHLNQIKSP